MAAVSAFIAIAYALSIALSLTIGLTGGHNSPLIALGYVSMLLPAISVVIVRAVWNEGPCVKWESLPSRYLPLALFLMPVVMHAVMLPIISAQHGGLRWKPVNAGGVLVNAFVGLIIVSVLAFFE